MLANMSQIIYFTLLQTSGAGDWVLVNTDSAEVCQ